MLLRIAWRSLWRNSRRTLITLSSISFGLAIALFVAGFFEGLYNKAINDAVRFQSGHLTVEHPKYRAAPSPALFVPSVAAVRAAAAAVPEVERLKPLVLGNAVIQAPAGSAGVAFVGVEPEVEAALSPLPRKVTQGRYLAQGDARGVVVGAELARRLKLEPGSKVVLTTNNIRGELENELLVVSGVFKMGTEELDGLLIHVPIGVARRVLGLSADQATQVGIVLRAPNQLEPVRQQLSAALAGQPVVLSPWREVLSEFVGFLDVNRGTMFIMRSVLLALVGFTILNTILMSVIERHREFAVVLALGTSNARLRAQILVEAALMAVVGTALGLLLGVLLNHLGATYGVNLSSTAGEGFSVGGLAIDLNVYNDLTPKDAAWQSAMVLVGTVVIALYPMVRSTRLDLATLLRSRQ